MLPAISTNLTDQDRADLARFIRQTIDADRYPLSPRVRRLKELLAKIDPAPALAVTPYPAAAAAGAAEHGEAAGMLRKRYRANFTEPDRPSYCCPPAVSCAPFRPEEFPKVAARCRPGKRPACGLLRRRPPSAD
jgi:hypothetical protein